MTLFWGQDGIVVRSYVAYVNNCMQGNQAKAVWGTEIEEIACSILVRNYTMEICHSSFKTN